MTALKQYSRDPNALNMPWLDSPFAEELIENLSLTPENKQLCRDYRENGYVVIDSGLSESLIDSVIESAQPYYRQNALRTFSSESRIQDAWLAPDHKLRCSVRAVATHEHILDTLRLLYQREPVPFQTLNFPVGTEQGTHSDHIHFSSEPRGFMCGVWIALEDVHSDAGPLHYYPGSHRLPFIDPVTMGFSGSHRFQKDGTHEAMGAISTPYSALLHSMCHAQNYKKERLLVKKGQALIWAANLLHGGEPIQDRRLSRHSQVSHYYFEGSSFYSPLLSDPYLGRVATRPVINMRTLREHPQEYANIKTTQENRDRIWSTPTLNLDKNSSCRPFLIETKKIKRLLLWPDYNNHESLSELVKSVMAPLQKDEDLAFCFYRNPESDPPRDRIEASLLKLLNNHLGPRASHCDAITIVDHYLNENEWNRLQTEVTAVYISKAGLTALRRLELLESRLPVFTDALDAVDFLSTDCHEERQVGLREAMSTQSGY